MSLKDCVEKDNRLLELHYQVDNLVREYNQEVSSCSHEVVFNFGEDGVLRKIGPCNIYRCLVCHLYYEERKYSFSLVETYDEDTKETEKNNPFADSIIIDVWTNNGQVINQEERSILLSSIKKMLAIELVENPGLTVLEFCELFNNKREDYKLELREKGKVKAKEKN